MKTNSTTGTLVAERDTKIARTLRTIRRDEAKHDMAMLVLECVAADDWALLEKVAHIRGKAVDDEKRASGIIDLERIRKLRALGLGGD